MIGARAAGFVASRPARQQRPFGKGTEMNRPSRTIVLGVLAAVMLLAGTSSVVFSHCEIPCGIYNDPMRLDMMAEHITTIEKSIKEIQRLSEAGPSSANQLVRWVTNKEQHANAFTEIVTQYFMAQRIKPAAESNGEAHAEYVRKLTLLHQMMITSMKSKQTTDLENVAALRSLLAEFRTAYLGPAAAGHSH